MGDYSGKHSDILARIILQGVEFILVYEEYDLALKDVIVSKVILLGDRPATFSVDEDYQLMIHTAGFKYLDLVQFSSFLYIWNGPALRQCGRLLKNSHS